jgi:uncharacterized membrane protein YjfL (UPF0719 family)
MPFLQRVAETVLWSFIGVFIFYASLRLFDRLDPIDYQTEVRNGNTAAAIILASVVLAISAIVIAVILSP